MAKFFDFLLIIALYVYLFYLIFRAIFPRKERLKLKKNVPYYRDIPTKKYDLVFWIGIKYGLIEDKYDFIGVLLLKWLSEKKIKLIKKDNKIYIDFSTHLKTPNNYERKFYHNILAVAGANHILDEHEFVNYILYHKDQVEELFRDLMEEVEEYLIANQLIIKKPGLSKATLIISTELENIVINIHGLKMFLEDFSLIEEKRFEEVILWDDYLMYAQLFGMTEKLQEEIKNIYPSQVKVNNLNFLNASIIGSLILSIKMGLNNFRA